VLFAADELNVLPYHRLVRDLGGLTPEQFLTKLRTVAEVSKTSEPTGDKPGSFGMFLGGEWYRVQLPSSAISAVRAKPPRDAATANATGTNAMTVSWIAGRVRPPPSNSQRATSLLHWTSRRAKIP
jgi:hypothetical protein